MIIQFYEKPGCVNNTKQKKMLEDNGHTVIAHSLLTHPWTKSTLRLFFGDLPVVDWFNKAAPRIKSGEVYPESYDEETALIAMLADPLLIRRPLIDAKGQLACGFDNALVTELLDNANVSHLQSCPNLNTGKNCD